MPDTKRDKYDEAAEKIQALYHQGVYAGDTEKISAILHSVFPPPAKDARRCAERLIPILCYPTDHPNVDKAAAEIESFAQSRVEPWREALAAIANASIKRINQDPYPCGSRACRLMSEARALLSDSPAKEATP